jgi:FkbM family methyltransferase
MQSLKQAIPLELRRNIKIGRPRAFESIGSSRFSRPGLLELDLKLSAYIQLEPGVFLEIGAKDGYSQSNTYHLERQQGWRGILIEPLPPLFERCRKGRPASKCFNFACVAPDGPASVDLVDLGLMSVTLGAQSIEEETRRLSGLEGRRFTVPATTLSSIIDQAGARHKRRYLQS